MIIRSPPNRQRNVSHHGKENCRCIALDQQIKLLKKSGCSEVYSEVISGANSKRPMQRHI